MFVVPTTLVFIVLMGLYLEEERRRGGGEERRRREEEEKRSRQKETAMLVMATCTYVELLMLPPWTYLVVRRTRGACQVVYAINFEKARLDNVMEEEGEPGVVRPLLHIALPSGEEIIEDVDVVPSLHQRVLIDKCARRSGFLSQDTC